MSVKTAMMPFKSAVTRPTAELLLDLVEIKLGCVEIYDRDDRRELKALERARDELLAMLGRSAPAASRLDVMRPPRAGRRSHAALHA